MSTLGALTRTPLHDLVLEVARCSGKAIEISEVGDRSWGNLTGLLLANSSRARILIRRSDPRWFQLHVVLHELAHILLGHQGCEVLPAGLSDLKEQHEFVVLGRSSRACSSVSQALEAEAEELAMLWGENLLRPPHAADEAALA